MKDFVVNVSFFGVQNGGFVNLIPLRPRFRCNAVFSGIDELSDIYYHCRIAVDYYGKEIYSWDRVEGLILNFLSFEKVSLYVFPGVRFSLWRGRFFAEGEIILIRDSIVVPESKLPPFG